MVFVQKWKFRNYYLYDVLFAILDGNNVDLLKFSKGVSLWFLAKISNFEVISLLGKQVRECVWRCYI